MHFDMVIQLLLGRKQLLAIVTLVHPCITSTLDKLLLYLRKSVLKTQDVARAQIMLSLCVLIKGNGDNLLGLPAIFFFDFLCKVSERILVPFFFVQTDHACVRRE